MPLATVMMSGVDPGPFVGEELAGPAHAALDLVEDQQRRRSRRRARAGRAGTASGTARMPPSPWIGSIRTARRLGPDRRVERVVVAERQRGRSPAAAGRSPWSSSPSPPPRSPPSCGRGTTPSKAMMRLRSGLAVVVEVLARHLDRAFDRLGARVGHEDGVGEGVRHQPLGQRLLVGDLVEVRGVPELARLRLERRHQLPGWRGRAGVHRDARAEVEIALAGLGGQPGALRPRRR